MKKLVLILSLLFLMPMIGMTQESMITSHVTMTGEVPVDTGQLQKIITRTGNNAGMPHLWQRQRQLVTNDYFLQANAYTTERYCVYRPEQKDFYFYSSKGKESYILWPVVLLVILIGGGVTYGLQKMTKGRGPNRNMSSWLKFLYEFVMILLFAIIETGLMFLISMMCYAMKTMPGDVGKFKWSISNLAYTTLVFAAILLIIRGLSGWHVRRQIRLKKSTIRK